MGYRKKRTSANQLLFNYWQKQYFLLNKNKILKKKLNATHRRIITKTVITINFNSLKIILRDSFEMDSTSAKLI